MIETGMSKSGEDDALREAYRRIDELRHTHYASDTSETNQFPYLFGDDPLAMSLSSKPLYEGMHTSSLTAPASGYLLTDRGTFVGDNQHNRASGSGKPSLNPAPGNKEKNLAADKAYANNKVLSGDEDGRARADIEELAPVSSNLVPTYQSELNGRNLRCYRRQLMASLSRRLELPLILLTEPSDCPSTELAGLANWFPVPAINANYRYHPVDRQGGPKKRPLNAHSGMNSGSGSGPALTSESTSVRRVKAINSHGLILSLGPNSELLGDLVRDIIRPMEERWRKIGILYEEPSGEFS
ncbi:unnamed protein product [Protopolystoma xenopodis]|uniref:Uncharacterized protein n=1 Tax=Protopolystoma xenopodis TaxID=117903 RepID=A0A448WM00_9PLAT|nr:unnamed protein product [Protopolystoma xenopodis]